MMKIFAMNRFGGVSASDIFIVCELSSGFNELGVITSAVLEKYEGDDYCEGSTVDEAVRFCKELNRVMLTREDSKTTYFYDTNDEDAKPTQISPLT